MTAALALDEVSKSFGPIEVLHGQFAINGYRIGNFAYLTDTSRIPESSYHLLDGEGSTTATIGPSK